MIYYKTLKAAMTRKHFKACVRCPKCRGILLFSGKEKISDFAGCKLKNNKFIFYVHCPKCGEDIHEVNKA